MIAAVRIAARDHVRSLTPEARAALRATLLTGAPIRLNLPRVGAVSLSARDLLVATTDLFLEPVA